MTAAGWLFMVCSLGFVLLLVVFCFHRVLSTPAAADREDTPPDVGADAPDR
ncbi:MAG: hypothetical protein KA383_04950 [Phycisphaerae bacterium]|nr:hypothetical protein [Phycisphaerae bacterium]